MKIYDGSKLIAGGSATAHFWHRLPKKLEHVTIGFGYAGKSDVEPPEAQRYRIHTSLREFRQMMISVINSMR